MKIRITILLVFVSCLTWAQSVDTLYQSANLAYQNGNYEASITAFHAIMDQDLESADLYYNLANSYYKTTNIPSAILYYEKCLKLDPGHEDAEFNLQLANLRIADRIEATPQLFLDSFTQNILSQRSSASWGMGFLILLFASLILWVLYFLSKKIHVRKIGFIGGLFTLLLAILVFFIANAALHNETQQNGAILFSTNEYVKASPDASSTDLFIIHEGVKMRVKDEIGDWVNIQLADGKEGWIPRESIETI